MIYLLGYQFTDTLIVLTKDAIHVVASSKKLRHLEPLKAAAPDGISLHLLERSKEQTDAHFERVLAAVRGSEGGKVIAILRKEKATGAFAASFAAALEKAGAEGSEKIELTELSKGLAGVLAVKDNDEVAAITQSATLSGLAMRRCFVNRMEGIIDEEKTVKQSTIAEEVDACLATPEGSMLK